MIGRVNAWSVGRMLDAWRSTRLKFKAADCAWLGVCLSLLQSEVLCHGLEDDDDDEEEGQALKIRFAELDVKTKRDENGSACKYLIPVVPK